MKAFRKPFGNLPEDPFATSPKHPLGRPSSKPPSKTLSEPPSFEDPLRQPARSLLSETLFEDPLRDVPKPPFEALRRTPRVTKPFRSRREALPSAPSKPSPEP